jgi:hypothetical protein
VKNLAESMILVGGFYNLAFAAFHVMFWRIFRWKEDLASLTFTNRCIMQILNLRLTYVFLVMAYVSFFHGSELLTTNLGVALLAAFSLFWFMRMVEQIFYFGIKSAVSLAFTVVFFLGGAIYLIPLV